MKKILFTIFSMCFYGATYAQISGVQAPDFTVTDVNGQTHTLSTYLAQGKTVLLDISATWCGPCWNFHQGKAMEDLYNAYGPNGSNSLVVLFVEGDPQTTLADLNGSGTNTQGDWLTGTPYPVINDDTLADLYEIAFYPTLFRICPNGIVTNINTGSATVLRNNLNTNCGTMTAAQNHARILFNELNTCATTGSPVARIRNYGLNNITSATAVLKENGTTIATKNYTGNLTMFNNGTITFDPISLNASSNYETQITSINTVAPFNNILTDDDLTLNLANTSTLNAQVRVYTDNYPAEMTWRIKNGAGTIVASGGPYIGAAGGAAGGPDANVTKIQNIVLADANDCYSVELSDSFGDGWGLGPLPNGLEIFNGTTSILNLSVGNFGTLFTRPAAFKTTAALSIDENNRKLVSLLPNPSNGIFNLNTEELVNISIFDITGKRVFSGNSLDNGSTVNLTQMGSGLYLAKISNENFTKTIKLVIK